MDHSWLSFASDVTVRSARPVEECVRSLQTLTAPPNGYSRDQRKRPFRGEITASGGSLRGPLFQFTFAVMPFRLLKFVFISSASGTELRGRWVLLKRIRIPVAIYLTLCLIDEIVELVRVIWIHPPDPILSVVGPLIGFAMIYGWTWVGVALNRRAEAQLVSAVFHAMESDRSAKITSELLSSPQ
jgi:hypothetical protein